MNEKLMPIDTILTKLKYYKEAAQVCLKSTQNDSLYKSCKDQVKLYSDCIDYLAWVDVILYSNKQHNPIKFDGITIDDAKTITITDEALDLIIIALSEYIDKRMMTMLRNPTDVTYARNVLFNLKRILHGGF